MGLNIENVHGRGCIALWRKFPTPHAILGGFCILTYLVMYDLKDFPSGVKIFEKNNLSSKVAPERGEFDGGFRN